MAEPTTHMNDPGAEEPTMEQIVAEEERVLERVLRNIAARRLARAGSAVSYDADLVALRDEIGEARLEDVPALVAQMERLQQVASRRSQLSVDHVDPRSPYFGRIVLQEGDRRREVLIGRGTYLDSRTGVRIVDWRDAPVSRIYYRYDEGDDYDETFGGKPIEGDVLVRRSVAIVDGILRRVVSPQGTFVKRRDGSWMALSGSATSLHGGQGKASRPDQYHKPGTLGVGADGAGREEKFLPEIAALIDKRQFDLITRRDSGLVVIQGGAGSGKTTIGLHRMAYLAFQDPKRFRADRMMVVVFNRALARYISHVLPALGVAGVPVVTFEDWASKQRQQHVRNLPSAYSEDTPSVVTRLKKHPVMLELIDERAAALAEGFWAAIAPQLGSGRAADAVRERWRKSASHGVAARVVALAKWAASEEGQDLPLSLRHAIEREAAALRAKAADTVAQWADLLSDYQALRDGFARHAPGAFEDRDLRAAHAWCVRQCHRALSEVEERTERQVERRSRGPERESDDARGSVGVDGALEQEAAALDQEDDALLLRLVQRMRGGLRRNKDTLRYEHVFVDEAQDLSPVELAVVFDTVRSESVTLAGDVAQRLLMDNGFSDWRGVLGDLGMSHVAVEPLNVGYRSTQEIMDVANAVLGPLANREPHRAARSGVPVELFGFSHTGDAVGFLAESLRALAQAEPLASIAVIARYPEQADAYFDGFRNAEVPRLRRIADQDFPFKAGVDVTDVRQVKGLEFDYVVLVEVSASAYPADDESRHLLHIATTRAAHQLWIATTGEPSLLLPESLRERAY